MGSAVFELALFSIPSMFYLWCRRHSGHGDSARMTMGLTVCPPSVYLQGLAVTVPLVALAVAALAPIRTGALHGSVTVVGKAMTPSGYAAVVVLAFAEEMLFRGFIAGLLFRRFGFRVGNALQALVFVAPHSLLLLVSVSLWPILPVQLSAGWLLGWLRYRSGSIGPSWFAHSVANVLASVLLAL